MISKWSGPRGEMPVTLGAVVYVRHVASPTQSGAALVLSGTLPTDFSSART